MKEETDPTNDTNAPAPQAESRPDVARPTRCRIVEFTNEDGDTYPAMVSAADDTSLHLTVFDAVMGPRLYCVALDAYGEGRQQWRWPARV